MNNLYSIRKPFDAQIMIALIAGPNIAYRKTAEFWKTYGTHTANRAVDNNNDTYAIGYKWWGVDLEHTFLVTGIKIITDPNNHGMIPQIF